MSFPELYSIWTFNKNSLSRLLRNIEKVVKYNIYYCIMWGNESQGFFVHDILNLNEKNVKLIQFPAER